MEILIILILPVVMGIFYTLKQREESKLDIGEEFVVKTSKGIRYFFFGFMVMLFAIMVIVAIFAVLDEMPSLWVFLLIEGIVGAFLSISIAGYVLVRFKYYIVKEDGILIHNIFKKSRFISYNDIKYIIFFSQSIFGELATYDEYGRPLFAIDNFHIGVENLYEILKGKECEEFTKNFPPEEIKKTKEYQIYKRKSGYKVGFGCCLFIALCFAGMGGLFSLSSYREFENYNVVGNVKEYTVGKNVLSIYLENDDREYYVNNIVYEALDEDLYDVLEVGKYINLYIAYRDDSGRCEISQIEVDGVIYLSMDKAAIEEYSNYVVGENGSYVCFGLTGIMSVFSIVYIFKLMKINKEE